MNECEFRELMALLQNSGESERIEAKEARHSSGKSVLETLSAFSNEPEMRGGYLVLGLRKRQGGSAPCYEIVGVADPDKLQCEIVVQCRQGFNVPLRPEFRLSVHDGKNILLIYIPEAEPHEKPIYITSKGIDRGAFRRIGPTDQLCTQEDLDYLYQRRSRLRFEETLLENFSLDDVAPAALSAYRAMRQEVNKNADELKYSDEDLLKSLGVLIPSKGGHHLNVAGLVLFGSERALRWQLPMAARVDFITIDGREWVPDPDRRYEAVEVREALLTAIPRLLQLVMRDIPQAFALDADELFRIDNPVVPRKAIREAICNALMHRDYAFEKPVQFRRYTNRIEFDNGGYSLKPDDQLGLPGSVPRNKKIADILHEVNLAETKGTGIRTIRDAMKGANLTAPLIESNRAYNQYTLTLLTHHLFGQSDIEWLSGLKHCNLTDEEARALVLIRELGAITNADYRGINDVDTLTASGSLRRLRDLGLLMQKGGGARTYYVPTKALFRTPPTSEGAPPTSEGAPPTSEGAPPTSASSFNLSSELQLRVEKMGRRASAETVRGIVRELCVDAFLTPSLIGKILGRSASRLRERHLTPMLEAGELELLYPHQPAHPKQAYRSKKVSQSYL